MSVNKQDSTSKPLSSVEKSVEAENKPGVDSMLDTDCPSNVEPTAPQAQPLVEESEDRGRRNEMMRAWRARLRLDIGFWQRMVGYSLHGSDQNLVDKVANEE